MKHILLFSLLLSSLVVRSQVEVLAPKNETVIGKVKSGGYDKAKLYYTVDDNDTIYTLFYRDARYSTLSSYERFKFAETGGTLEALYQTLRKTFDEPKKAKVRLMLGDDIVIAQTEFSFGKELYLSGPNGILVLNSRQLDKLFNK